MKNKTWHTIPLADLEKELGTSRGGLKEEDATRLLEEYGPNQLEHKGSTSFWSMVFGQFKDFMVVVLIIAALISGLLGEIGDSVIILVIVAINAALGIIQENKAEESLAALKKMSSPNAKVIRDGIPKVLDSGNLVPGDVVIIETGDFVPADLRLIEVSNLKIDEASLTGESVPVEKYIADLDGENIPIGDRVNMAYSGSLVTYGRGKGIAVSTGMSTQMGSIAKMIQSHEGLKTPLQKKLESLGKVLGMGALGICGLIFAIGIGYGKDVFEMFFTSVSLAVAAIPEGLPAIVTIVLAIGVQRMAKRNVIIRRLPAVETLGSATVICSDKTGTLTQNKMTVREFYYNREFSVADKGSKISNDHLGLLISAGVLCNDTQIREAEGGRETIGDPTETALVQVGLDYGIDKRSLDQELKRVHEIPFDSQRKLMTTVHHRDNMFRIFTKGGTDEVLSRCDRLLLKGEIKAMTPKDLDDIKRANEKMASGALRVLSFAYRDLDRLPGEDEKGGFEEGLIFLGLMGMIDPPREEVKEAVMLCKKAGIKPVMITGDHKITAKAIAEELGILDGGQAITGPDLESMGDAELEERVKDISVYARVAPEHKVRIVKAWQKWGHIVAMTGDGVNDAPALKVSNIGAAMGIVGTDVAKEAAHMVLTDDNFSTIVSAVEEGRIIFSNILKSIQFLLSCNIGELLLLLVATSFNWREPLLPIHILWVNLITDSLPALALGVDPAEKDIMEQSPRDPKKGIFYGSMVVRIAYQGVMIGSLALLAFIIGQGTDLVTGRTMAFATLSLSQLVHTFNVRSNDKSILTTGIFTNTRLIWAVVFSAALQVLVIVLPPLRVLFKVGVLNLEQWLRVGALSASPLLLVEIIKFFTRRGHLFFKKGGNLH